jgi:flagellar hook-associated protein 2
MSTIPSALNSAQTATFNGTSQYAGDLQQAINQAVAIASIPLTQLQDNVSTLQSESGELSNLQNNFNGLQTAIQQLSSSTGTGGLAASVANNNVASVTVDSAASALPGTYDLNVISAGSSTTTLSNNGLPTVSDPNSTSISSSASFTLSVNGTNTTITPSSNTLNALAQAINSANAGVTATILNIGPPSAPDYRLSLESTELGADSIQLNDGSNPLLTALTTGTPAQYQVDGQPTPTPISSTSSTITLAPGVTANLLQAGDTTVTVATDSSAAANALSAFATAYNSTLAELSVNHGTNGGALTGQGIILQLEQSLGNLVQYTGSGNVQSIADLGLTFNSQGQLTFDQATFDNAEATNPGAVSAFLGSSTGGGFLTNATNVLNQAENANTGLFAQTQNSYQSQVTSDNSEITDTEARITTMQNNMTAQMSQADSTIASLESQVTYFTTLFSDEQNDSKNNG